jgi:hypothetical protein
MFSAKTLGGITNALEIMETFLNTRKVLVLQQEHLKIGKREYRFPGPFDYTLSEIYGAQNITFNCLLPNNHLVDALFHGGASTVV